MQARDSVYVLLECTYLLVLILATLSKEKKEKRPWDLIEIPEESA